MRFSQGVTVQVLAVLSCLAWNTEASIRLRSRTIDTESAYSVRTLGSNAFVDNNSLRELRTTADGRSAYLVQFEGPVTAENQQQLIEIGAMPEGYVPDNAQIILLHPDGVDALADIKSVRWVGGYQAEDKRSPELALSGSVRASDIEVILCVWRPAYLKAVMDAVMLAGGMTVESGVCFRRATLRVKVSSTALNELSALAEVEWIEPYVQPELMNNVALDADHANVLVVRTNRGVERLRTIHCHG